MVLDTAFESERTYGQREFTEWIRSRADDKNRFELLNRRILMNPPSGWPHGETVALVIGSLIAHVRARRSGRVFGSDQGFELPSGDTVSPDASFLSTSRWAEAGPHELDAFVRAVPELVVEILSPSTAARDRGEKKAIYERNGVAEYWIVDTRSRRVQVFRLRGGRYGDPDVYEEADTVVSEILPELDVGVAGLLP